MKRWKTRVLAAATAATMTLGLSGAALAAEPEPQTPAAGQTISVQLDGKNLVFTDAVPQVKDQRTFLPFRAVFEAMGAQVDNEGNVITAVRGGKTLTMTIGSTSASVVEDGVTTDITMDVAPYVDSATWRTYVPVRFAAQAFGCAVGWDQEAQTAVIVDVETLVDDALGAYTYDNLSKYMDYSAQFQTGSWATTGTLNGTYTFMELSPMTVEATYEGIASDNNAVEMSMTMTMDMDAFLTDLADQAGGSMDDLTAEGEALLETLKSEGIRVDVRGDMSQGVMYMNLSGNLFTAAGIPENTWIAIDMNELLAASGAEMDWSALMSAAQELSSQLDLRTLLTQSLGMASVDDSATAYASLKNGIDTIAAALADQSFTQEGDDRLLSYSMEANGIKASASLTLHMADDAVSGYAMQADLSITSTEGTVAIAFSDAMDADNTQTTTFSLTLGDMVSMEYTATASYTATEEVPQTTPPEDADIISVTDLIDSAAAGGQTGVDPAPAA